MRLQRCDTAFQWLAGDIHAMCRPWVSGHQQPAHRPRLQALADQLREDPPITGVAQRIQCGKASDPVIGLVQPGDELHVPGPDQHSVWPEGADDAGDVAAQGQAVFQHAVRIIKEVDLGYADRLRTGHLLLGAQPGRLRWRAAVHACFAAGQQQIGHLHAPGRPRRDR